MRLNLAAFYYNYKDIQVTYAPGLIGQIFANAAAARNYGVDAEFDFAVTHDFTLSTGLGYLNAKYTDYPDALSYNPFGIKRVILNAKGLPLVDSPPFTGFASGNYRIPTSIGDFVIVGTVSYTDAYLWAIDPDAIEQRAVMVNGQVQWLAPGKKGFSIRLWGRNLANMYTYTAAYESSGGWYGFPDAPREYGITFRQDF